MKHIRYVIHEDTPPQGGFFVSLFNPRFWGFFLTKIYNLNKGVYG